jgi:hypothetical protein
VKWSKDGGVRRPPGAAGLRALRARMMANDWLVAPEVPLQTKK